MYLKGRKLYQIDIHKNTVKYPIHKISPCSFSLRQTKFTAPSFAENSYGSTFLFRFRNSNSPCIQVEFLFKRFICYIVQHGIIVCINPNGTTYHTW